MAPSALVYPWITAVTADCIIVVGALPALVIA
jgi:hypothetical protein